MTVSPGAKHVLMYDYGIPPRYIHEYTFELSVDATIMWELRVLGHALYFPFMINDKVILICNSHKLKLKQ